MYFESIREVIHYLRCHCILSSKDCPWSNIVLLNLKFLWKSEIGYFVNSIMNENVFRFDITVDDSISMELLRLAYKILLFHLWSVWGSAQPIPRKFCLCPWFPTAKYLQDNTQGTWSLSACFRRRRSILADFHDCIWALIPTQWHIVSFLSILFAAWVISWWVPSLWLLLLLDT